MTLLESTLYGLNGVLAEGKKNAFLSQMQEGRAKGHLTSLNNADLQPAEARLALAKLGDLIENVQTIKPDTDTLLKLSRELMENLRACANSDSVIR